MIDLDPGDELRLVAETARKLAQEELAPRLRDAEAAREVDAEVRAAVEEIGLSTLELPEAANGAGLGALARVLVNEELAAGDAGAALALDPLGPALYPALEMGGAAGASALAQRVAAPGSRAILVTDADAAIEIRADRVSLHVPWVPADRVDALVALQGQSALLIGEGIDVQPLRGAGLRAAGASELRVDAPLRERWTDAAGAERALARARLYVASLLLGVMRATCEFSAAYAQERQAFGRPIAHHQALAFLITDMRIALDGARLLVHEAAWRIDRALPAAAAAASAYAQCIDAARSVGPDGVQILGGHGFMADYPVEKHMREARALGLLFGGFDAAVHDAGSRLVAAGTPLALASGEGL